MTKYKLKLTIDAYNSFISHCNNTYNYMGLYLFQRATKIEIEEHKGYNYINLVDRNDEVVDFFAYNTSDLRDAYLEILTSLTDIKAIFKK